MLGGILRADVEMLRRPHLDRADTRAWGERMLGGLVEIVNRHFDLLAAADMDTAAMLQRRDRLVIRTGFMLFGLIDEYERFIVDLDAQRFESQVQFPKSSGFG